MKRHFNKEDIQRANKHMKRCLTPSTIRGEQIKMTMRSQYLLIRMATNKNSDDTKCQ